MSRSIDSHVHIWDRSRNEIFIAENQHPSLKGKSFLPSDLQTILKDTLCKQAVLVHGPATIEHSKFCIDLCKKHDFIALNLTKKHPYIPYVWHPGAQFW